MFGHCAKSTVVIIKSNSSKCSSYNVVYKVYCAFKIFKHFNTYKTGFIFKQPVALIWDDEYDQRRWYLGFYIGDGSDNHSIRVDHLERINENNDKSEISHILMIYRMKI